MHRTAPHRSSTQRPRHSRQHPHRLTPRPALLQVITALFPKFRSKAAITRAYRTVQTGTGFISRREYRVFLQNFVKLNELWPKFQKLDRAGDKRMSFDEFRNGECAATAQICAVAAVIIL